MSAPGFALSQLAERFGLQCAGAGDARITGVATLADAGPGELGFLANPHYRAQLRATRAGAVVLAAEDQALAPGAALISRNPYADFARIAALFETRPATPAGVHASAVIASDADIDAGAHIGPHCVIGARSKVAAGAVLGPGCIIGHDCVVGPQCRLVARVTLVERVRLGARVLIHPGAVLGADGFGLAQDQGNWIKVPQLGGVVIGDDCEVGANTCIDRGALGDTVLHQDVRLDNLIQIAHNVEIGAHTAIAGCAGISGSTKIGAHCLIGGAAGFVGHIEICDRVTISGGSRVTHSIREPGVYTSGTALQAHKLWRRNAARFNRLDELARKILSED
jgi:UDP-3-O-[3-hydroxymyristoyl] glucosamine N-acyltransferase